MKNIRLFQVFVVLTTATYVVWFFLPYWSGYLPDQAQRLADHNGYGADIPTHFLIYSTWFCLWLIAALGLFFFQNWARHLFLALSLLELAMAPFSGFVVQPPIDALFSHINLLLDGAILAMAYLSPLSVFFLTEAPNKALQSTPKKRRG